MPEIPIQSFGAVVPLQLGVSNERRKSLLQQKRPVPDPQHVYLLIDTGATCSWIRPEYVAKLGLPKARSWLDVRKTNGVVERLEAYEVCLILGGAGTPSAKRVDTLIGIDDFSHEPHDGLLGRDILQLLQFAWNGPSATVRVNYP